MKLSIIIPIYNVERYLNKCIDSVINQNYDDYEVLLIDDGSIDYSGKICDRYSKEYSFIKTFHKSNSGLSDARNYGITRATGEYIIFVDGDDFLQENVLSKIAEYLKQNKCEIMITRLVESFENENIEKDKNILNYLNNNLKLEALKWILEKSQNSWPAVKYIVSRKFINENNLRFKSGFLHEDIEWTSLLCIYGQKFGYFEPIWYYHRMNRPNSITNTMNEKRIIDVIKIAYDCIEGKYSSKLNSLSIQEKKILINRIMSSFYTILFKSVFLDDRQIDIVSNELYSMKKILNYAPKFKYKLFVLSIKIFGFKRTIKIAKYIK